MDIISDLEKLKRLYCRYGKLMYKKAYRILNDTQLAEDAVQRSFEKVSKHLHKINEKNCPNTRNYLVTICRNTSIDMLKKKIKSEIYYREMDEFPCQEESDPLEILVSNETINEMSEAIKGLAPKYRDVLILRYIQEHSRQEIADILGITIYAVDKRLTRAKNKVISAMKGSDRDE